MRKRKKDEKQYIVGDSNIRKQLEYAFKAGQRDRFPAEVQPQLGDVYIQVSTNTAWTFASTTYPFWVKSNDGYSVVFESHVPR